MGLLQLLYTFPTDHNYLVCPFSKSLSPGVKWYLLLTISFRFFRIVVLINLHFLQLSTAQLHSFSQTKGPLRRCIVLEKGLWC